MKRYPAKAQYLIFIGMIILFWGSLSVGRDRQSPLNLYVIPISGDVKPSMAAFLKRALSEIPDTADTRIILEMDTFGGRVDSALEMVDTLINVENAETIAYISKKAISAGALISLACNRLVMKKSTTIGDCAPIIYSSEGPKMMGEKFQSPLRAKFRTLAKRNGYPEALTEAMVTADMVVYRITLDGNTLFIDDRGYEELEEEKKKRIISKKTVVAAGELLTMDDKEAYDLGFSTMSVKNLDDMLDRMDLSAAALIRIEPSWSEALTGLIGVISPVLMMIGLGLLYTEIKSPGFGVPGILGAVCLALVFFNQYLVGLADHTEFLIVAIGLVLMAFEVFVFPGFGLAGIAGILCIALGLLLSLQDFVIPDPNLPWEREILTANLLKILSAVLGSVLVALLILRYIFPRLSKVVAGPYLSTTLTDARVDLFASTSLLKEGQTGTALSLLRPSGKADIGGERYDVITQGDFVPKGSEIKIVKIKGNKIIVTGTDLKSKTPSR